MRAVRDHAVVVLLGALALIEAATQEYDAPRSVGIVSAVALVLPLPWRRAHPVRTAGACLSVYVVMLAAGAFAQDAGAAPALAIIVVAYAAGRHLARGIEVAGTVGSLLVVGLAAGLVWQTGITVSGFLFAVGFVGGAALLGRVVRREFRRGVRLGRELRRLIAEMETGAAAAVDAERAAIAADLHDLGGHGLTLVTLHADATRTLLRTRPERAAAQLRELHEAAGATEAELEGLVERLRARDEAEAVAAEPVPSLQGFAGEDVEVAVGAGWDELPRSVAGAAARVVQEALTNARKHAVGARVRVVAGVDDGVAWVEVVDDGGEESGLASGGFGLAAMRERVELLGGVVEAGPLGGGWRVSASLPVAADAGRVDHPYGGHSAPRAWRAVSLWAPAIVLGVAGAAEALVLEDAGDPGVRAGAYVVGAAALLLRRRYPLAVAAVVGAAVLVRFVPATLSPSSSVATPLAAVAAYSAVTHARRVVAGAVAAAALVVVLAVAFVVERGDVLPADLLFLPLLVAGAGLAGAQVRLHRARARGLRRATDTAAARAAAARAEAARRERLRLVGELTAITTALLGEAEVLIARAEAALPDTERCAELLTEVSARSRASLDELRRLVTVLRRPEGGVERAPDAPGRARV